MYDGDGTIAPEISVESDPNDDEATQVLLDGIAIATVQGSQLGIDDITLMPLAVAQSMGFAPV